MKKIDLDKMDLVEKMSQITQVRQKRSASLTKNNAFMFQEKLATYTPKKQEEQTEEQKRIKEAILQVKTCIFLRKFRSKSARPPLQLMKMCKIGRR